MPKSKPKSTLPAVPFATLLDRYRALKPVPRAILRLMAIGYAQLPQNAIAGAGLLLRLKFEDGRPFDSNDLRPVLAELLHQGLVVQPDSRPVVCHPQLLEPVIRDALRDGVFEPMAAALERVAPVPKLLASHRDSFDTAMRKLRLHLYRHEAAPFWLTLEIIEAQYQSQCAAAPPIQTLFNDPFDPEFFASLPDTISVQVFWLVLVVGSESFTPAEEMFAYLCDSPGLLDHKEHGTGLRLLVRAQWLWRGNTEAAERAVEGQSSSLREAGRGATRLLKGEYAAAAERFDKSLADFRATSNDRAAVLPAFDSVFHALALLATGTPAALATAEKLLKRHARNAQESAAPAAAILLAYVESRLNKPPSSAAQRARAVWYDYPDPFDFLIQVLVAYWTDSPALEARLDALHERYIAAAASPFRWFAGEYGAILARTGRIAKRDADAVAGFYQTSGLKPLADIVRRQEAWERSLEALEQVAADGPDTPKPPAAEEYRLAWYVDFAGDYVTLEGRQVKRLSSGRWTKGKVISLRRLSEEQNSLTFLTPKDLEICSHIATEVDRYRYSPRVLYVVRPRAFLALVGHPLAFTSDGVPLEVVRAEPELHVSKDGDHVVIELSPRLDAEQEIALVRETNTRLRVVECRPEHRKIAGILARGLRVPADRQERALQALSRIASLITIHSDVGGGLENVPEVPSDPRPHLILTPHGAGLRLQVKTQPLAPSGSYYEPGTGGTTVLAEVDGKRVQTQRDLAQEQQLADDAVAACPVLEQVELIDGEWYIREPENCLELIDSLRDLGENAVVEWPQGEKFRIAQRASMGNLHVQISSGKNWFEASGQLQLDENRVLGIRELLDLLDEAQGRFVPLGDGQYVSLTKEFRRRLEELRALTEDDGDTLRIHPLAAPALDGFADEAASFKAQKAWKERIERFRAAQQFEPVVPSTLRATLRDYQAEGFAWMARLAQWGAGACLADDMGLGKTVQALALILEHAHEGPVIVVAPTSVCMNWIDEAQRFAPTLNPILFGPGDRKAVIDGLKPFDLLVCSYGLLYQEAESITGAHWRVAVLDEAQAIKNVATKRSQAAMNINADFRVITTGTPIENHLGELWNLFRFINPGLLGSLEQFNRRFATPIEKFHDKDARARLKRIIQPFILRRVKEQVLEELPSRTEILLHVEFSAEEAAFYEALRQQAIEKVAHSNANPGQKRMQILAEIMRLRRACCNPRLVNPAIGVASSKLAVFMDLVEELIENRHKALVFSQFVDHLSILREALDARGIAYQYLDGATPQKLRKKNVDAFQRGEGDLFLISLKAGGLGLNLTAADYVIHMDPWWNPAAEDQASDRAHRIGQLRPVTIYRLVTQDTIESKIVELHKHKRDLADSLLEGAEMTGKLSADQLLELLEDI